MTLTSAPRGETLVDAARALAPRIAAVAERIEAERALPSELVDALVDAGMFSLLLPRSLGGCELDLPTYVRAVEELARTDGSVAWCVGQANGLWSLLLHGDRETVRRVVATRPAILATGPGQGNRPGRAIVTEGGFRLTGRWMFASGIGHATWLLPSSHLFDADDSPVLEPDGKQSGRLMLIPKAQATVHDVWHVSGLRGTGTQSFSVSNLFVPDENAIFVTPQNRPERGPLYLFTIHGYFGPAFGSVALGLAHSSLAAIIDFAAGKVPRGMERSIRENASVQAAVALAQARLGAARSFLHATLSDVWQAVCRSGQLELDQQVRVRLASTHATHEAAAVVDTAYTLAGSDAIFEDLPFERRFRDVHAVTQQAQARRAHYENVGAYLLGLEPQRTSL